MTQINLPRMRKQLCLEEEVRLKPYRDTKGLLTTGIGRCLDMHPLSPSEIKVIGHDGRTQPITIQQAYYLLDDDIAECQAVLDIDLPWWRSMDEIRMRVLLDMTFNMGIHKVLKFVNTLKFMKAGMYEEAANHMQDSLWAQQTKTRATRLIKMMRTGEDFTS